MSNYDVESRLGVVGQGTRDGSLPDASYQWIGHESVQITTRGGDFLTLLPVSSRAVKTEVKAPLNLWDYVESIRWGGGGLNFAKGAAMSSHGFKVRYLESGSPDESLTAHLEEWGVSVEYLNLREMPCNIALGYGDDKRILKAPLDPAVLNEVVVKQRLSWLAECHWVVINSAKDRFIYEWLTEAAEQNRTRVGVVMTTSVPKGELRTRLLRSSSLVVGSADELPSVMDWTAEDTLVGAVRQLEMLREMAPSATCFVTMGKDGVLVGDPLGHISHIRLTSEIWDTAQRLVKEDRRRLVGVGDAFAGGTAAYLSTGTSILGCDPCRFGPQAVAAAAAGTASAMRWIGLVRNLGADDFEVDSDLSRLLPKSVGCSFCHVC